jgi:hypothetical protein
MSVFTGKTSVQWVKGFIHVHGKQHHHEMDAKELVRFQVVKKILMRGYF